MHAGDGAPFTSLPAVAWHHGGSGGDGGEEGGEGGGGEEGGGDAGGGEYGGGGGGDGGGGDTADAHWHCDANVPPMVHAILTGVVQKDAYPHAGLTYAAVGWHAVHAHAPQLGPAGAADGGGDAGGGSEGGDEGGGTNLRAH